MLEPLYQIFDSPRVNRRNFLLATSSLAAAALFAPRAFGAVTANPKFSAYPFQLGVASGDPASDGMVLWTRLAPDPVNGGGMPHEPVEVAWQVCEDEAMSKVVQKGTTIANPDWAHSVHVEVAGLKPDRWYWYQFKAGSEVSPKGRTRTTPAANVTAEKLRFAFASCQHYETGYYTAYEHMVKDDLDLVIHLGDYIYEGAARKDLVRQHNSGEIMTLEDYRNRLALYKSDDALKAMHAAAPWLVTWDDHEVSNNYAGFTPAANKQRALDFHQRRANAYKAYYEHMPLRRAALPTGPDMQLYRPVSYGQLAQFFVLDTRQYRTDQPCGDGRKEACEGTMDPKGTLLGDVQRQWLFDGLDRSSGKWNILAQQIMMARVAYKETGVDMFSMDQWPGYEVERRRVLKHFAEHKTVNPVVLTGDIHSNWANELVTDFDQLDSKVVATEFVGTSISSGGDGHAPGKGTERILSDNPFVKYQNAQRGYVRCEVTPNQWRTDYRIVEKVTEKGGPVKTGRSFIVESGQKKLNVA